MPSRNSEETVDFWQAEAEWRREAKEAASCRATRDRSGCHQTAVRRAKTTWHSLARWRVGSDAGRGNASRESSATWISL